MMELPVYLIGYMGAGKTTVGRLLAEELGWRFVDLDDAFLQIHGLTPAAYIRTYGSNHILSQPRLHDDGRFRVHIRRCPPSGGILGRSDFGGMR